jgi:TPR repeat protein
VPKDYAEGVKWYRSAAEQGDSHAQFNLGFLYAHGNGVPQNDNEAVKWYRLAAAQGVAEAQENLGWMLSQGRGATK